jgi:hypothetical protein
LRERRWEDGPLLLEREPLLERVLLGMEAEPAVAISFFQSSVSSLSGFSFTLPLRDSITPLLDPEGVPVSLSFLREMFGLISNDPQPVTKYCCTAWKMAATVQ